MTEETMVFKCEATLVQYIEVPLEEGGRGYDVKAMKAFAEGLRLSMEAVGLPPGTWELTWKPPIQVAVEG